MKYIFCGYMFSDVESDIKKMQAPPPVSGYTYMVNLVHGLVENGQDVTVVNTPLMRYFPHYPRVFVRGGLASIAEEPVINTGFINLPIINYITRAWSMKKSLRKTIRKLRGEEVTLVCFNIFFPVVSAMTYARRKFKNVRLCAVIGDLYGKNGTNTGSKPKGFKDRAARRFIDRAYDLSKKFDAYGFVTKFMPQEMGVESKPFAVIEGMYSESSEPTKSVAQGEEKIIFYAGSVRKDYGLSHLLKAFSLVKGKEYRLIIAGSPTDDAVEEVKAYAARDSRIAFLGVITPAEVLKRQQSATVLINPRISGPAFVKFSFPSKNMEGLASGKPYIAHDLICNPPEYREYIQCPADESDEALAQKIVEVCELPPEERQAIGERSREFILREKNPQKQCGKIVDMMSQITFQ